MGALVLNMLKDLPLELAFKGFLRHFNVANALRLAIQELPAPSKPFIPLLSYMRSISQLLRFVNRNFFVGCNFLWRRVFKTAFLPNMSCSLATSITG